MLDDWITASLAARDLGWTEAAVIRLVHEGTFPAARLPLGSYIVPERAVEDYARQFDMPWA